MDDLKNVSLIWFEMTGDGSPGVNKLVDSTGQTVNPSASQPTSVVKPSAQPETPFMTLESGISEPPPLAAPSELPGPLLWMDPDETMAPAAASVPLTVLGETPFSGVFGLQRMLTPWFPYDEPEVIPAVTTGPFHEQIPVADPPLVSGVPTQECFMGDEEMIPTEDVIPEPTPMLQEYYIGDETPQLTAPDTTAIPLDVVPTTLPQPPDLEVIPV